MRTLWNQEETKIFVYFYEHSHTHTHTLIIISIKNFCWIASTVYVCIGIVRIPKFNMQQEANKVNHDFVHVRTCILTTKGFGLRVIIEQIPQKRQTKQTSSLELGIRNLLNHSLKRFHMTLTAKETARERERERVNAKQEEMDWRGNKALLNEAVNCTPYLRTPVNVAFNFRQVIVFSQTFNRINLDKHSFSLSIGRYSYFQ